MAKTLEELQDAIRNVIAENDKGEITATHLQTVLLNMSETLSELGGSGGGNIFLLKVDTSKEHEYTDDGNTETDEYLTTTNQENIEHNKKVYDTLVEILDSGNSAVNVFIETSSILNMMFSGGVGTTGPFMNSLFASTTVQRVAVTEENFEMVYGDRVSYPEEMINAVIGKTVIGFYTMFNIGTLTPEGIIYATQG